MVSNFNRAYRNMEICEETLEKVMYMLEHEDDAYKDLSESDMMKVSRVMTLLNQLYSSLSLYF